MEYRQISKGRGFKYASENQLYRQYSFKRNTRYVRCDFDGCKEAAKISDASNLLYITEPHTDHRSQAAEIERLVVLERCRKRAADDPVTPLRQIFDDESRVDNVTSISFVNVESSMYKKRRLQQPALPLTADDAPEAIEGTRYSILDDVPFFQGSINAGMFSTFKFRVIMPSSFEENVK